ncbi:MAG: hypothetical protein LVQ64_00930 [Thermoplasmatales archaeon]|nr:hypothetical protein [Thermoplasmatales archaeon]
MTAVLAPLRLTPENEDDQIVVSKKGLRELERQAEERAREIERLRRENAELRRRLQVHENPNVPPIPQVVAGMMGLEPDVEIVWSVEAGSVSAKVTKARSGSRRG